MKAFLILALVVSAASAAPPTVADARAFTDKVEAELFKLSIAANRADWIAQTYITDDTEAITALEGEKLIARETELVNEAKKFEGLNLPADVKRKILLMKLGLELPAPSNAALREELTQVAASLGGSYGKGKYCPDPGAKCLSIDDLDERMATNRDPVSLEHMWTDWHKVGAPMRDRYARFVELSNQGARELGFADTGALWRSGYDMTPAEFSAELERLWTQLQPLYDQLHAYVRKKLIAKYGAAARRDDGMIPADLLGNMWAQEWGNVYDLVAPPSAPPAYDIGQILQQRKTTPRQVVEYGEGFFRSLGFEKLPDSFWERSQLTRPADRDVVCHASAWDIDADKDVRLKVCI
ncbi:MAG: M2 family metallopeptidase, partial [Acidobacteriota bacterium]|nr:M2 family metallopeptidase [Acidobacteriota bacterium]